MGWVFLCENGNENENWRKNIHEDCSHSPGRFSSRPKNKPPNFVTEHYPSLCFYFSAFTGTWSQSELMLTERTWLTRVCTLWRSTWKHNISLEKVKDWFFKHLTFKIIHCSHEVYEWGLQLESSWAVLMRSVVLLAGRAVVLRQPCYKYVSLVHLQIGSFTVFHLESGLFNLFKFHFLSHMK